MEGARVTGSWRGIRRLLHEAERPVLFAAQAQPRGFFGHVEIAEGDQLSGGDVPAQRPVAQEGEGQGRVRADGGGVQHAAERVVGMVRRGGAVVAA